MTLLSFLPANSQHNTPKIKVKFHDNDNIKLLAPNEKFKRLIRKTSNMSSGLKSFRHAMSSDSGKE